MPIETDPSLRGGVTLGDRSNGQGLFFTSEPCLRGLISPGEHLPCQQLHFSTFVQKCIVVCNHRWLVSNAGKSEAVYCRGDPCGRPIGINLSPERAWDGRRVDR